MKFYSQRLSGVLLIALCFLLMVIGGIGCGGGERTDFLESWESLPIKTYKPYAGLVPSMLKADEGFWLFGATVSGDPDCGPTPHTAEILMHNGSKALRLTSRESQSGCADNVYVALWDTSTVGPLLYNKGFSIPITNTTRVSFEEEGELSDPGEDGWGDSCILPPCFNNISLQIRDQHGNTVVYVLQRDPYAEPNENYANYIEIFLDPDARIYERNLFDDFSFIPRFNPTDAKIVFIQFQVNEHGWGIIDNIKIDSSL